MPSPPLLYYQSPPSLQPSKVLWQEVILFLYLPQLLTVLYELLSNWVLLWQVLYLCLLFEYLSLDYFDICEGALNCVSPPAEEADWHSSAFKGSDFYPLLGRNLEKVEGTSDIFWTIIYDNEDIGDDATILLDHLIESPIDAGELVQGNVVLRPRIRVGKIG